MFLPYLFWFIFSVSIIKTFSQLNTPAGLLVSLELFFRDATSTKGTFNLDTQEFLIVFPVVISVVFFQVRFFVNIQLY